MILVKLKMKKIYKLFLTLIGLLITLLIILGMNYKLNNDKHIDGSDINVDDNLSINYIDDKNFKTNGSTTLKFSVTNSGQNSSSFALSFLQVRGDGEYELKYKDDIIASGKLKSIDELTTDSIGIDTKETKLFTLKVTNSSEDPLKGEINIRNQSGKGSLFAEKIIKNSKVLEDAVTKVGEEVATSDEGLIKSSDDLGTSYYFRGNVVNNYVSFGGFTWRIVRINGDSSVRIVLDDVAKDVLASYYSEGNYDFEFKNSNMKESLDDWFNANLKNNVKYISNSKFCSDVSNDGNNIAYTRIMVNKIPTLNCLSNSFNNNIGLLTIDEVILAGAAPQNTNQNFYLYNSNISDLWYTMTGAEGSSNKINMFMIDSNGGINTGTSGNLFRNVRPVINLVKNINMEGDGTKDNPYKLVEVNE